MSSKKLRVLKMGLSTVLGIKPQGFFIPYRYADTVPGPDQRRVYAEIEGFFELAIVCFEEIITFTNTFRTDLDRSRSTARTSMDAKLVSNTGCRHRLRYSPA